MPPGTTCLLPNGRLLRRPSHICALGQDQTLGNIPKTLGLKNCDAMQYAEWVCGPISSLPSLLNSSTRNYQAVTVSLLLGLCAVQHKSSLLSEPSKTTILHRFYDPLSEFVWGLITKSPRYSLSYTEAILLSIAFSFLTLKELLCIQPRQGSHPTSTTGLANSVFFKCALFFVTDIIV